LNSDQSASHQPTAEELKSDSEPLNSTTAGDGSPAALSTDSNPDDQGDDTWTDIGELNVS